MLPRDERRGYMIPLVRDSGYGDSHRRDWPNEDSIDLLSSIGFSRVWRVGYGIMVTVNGHQSKWDLDTKET